MTVQTIDASEVIACCRKIAQMSEEPGRTTRTFLSPPMRDVHQLLREWMERIGMSVWVDAAGNLRGRYEGLKPGASRLLIGSHLDTVPNAGAFDGILGVVMGIALIESLHGRRLPFAMEIAAFSEEEGVRFGVAFIGSRALVGTADVLLERKDAAGTTVAQAIREFGIDPSGLKEAALQGKTLGYFEFHIEQGPVLESLNLPLGVVEGIAGQTVAHVSFRGRANHAGTTPMNLRHDAAPAAAEWVLAVEQAARAACGLVATVGQMKSFPGASNVIPGEVRMSLDVRHASDRQRDSSVESILSTGSEIARRRGVTFECASRQDQLAVACDNGMIAALEKAVARAGYPLHRMTSGAGHDAMILAAKTPISMLFLRSPGGISHHPDERVLAEDVLAALQTGGRLLDELESSYA